VIDAEIRPDAFQIGGGVLQVAAWLVAFDLVKHGDTEVTVHPMRGGGVIAISGRF
jgi:hypothetical protein